MRINSVKIAIVLFNTYLLHIPIHWPTSNQFAPMSWSHFFKWEKTLSKNSVILAIVLFDQILLKVVWKKFLTRSKKSSCLVNKYVHHNHWLIWHCYTDGNFHYRNFHRFKTWKMSEVRKYQLAPRAYSLKSYFIKCFKPIWFYIKTFLARIAQKKVRLNPYTGLLYGRIHSKHTKPLTLSTYLLNYYSLTCQRLSRLQLHWWKMKLTLNKNERKIK